MKDTVIGIVLVAFLLGGLLLLARRSTPVYAGAPDNRSSHNSNITFIEPIPYKHTEPAHYRNKETRRIEYNADGLPTLIEISRDYAIA
jgi:hypothetical protein